MRVSAADKVLPYIEKCVVCGIEKGVQDGLCPVCCEALKQLEHGKTQVKGYGAYCAYDYKDEAARLVRSFKYNDAKYLSHFMAQRMAKGIAGGCSCITYVPLHKKRKKRRGFDQAQTLAQQLSKITGLPLGTALVRTRNTKTQTKLDAQQRQQNMSGAFESTGSTGGRVVLVDDVLTTGATAAECAKTLLGSGADEVFILAFARAVGGAEKQTALARLLKKIF